MEFNSIQKYQKYKNKYLNLKNMNKINNNNITYFKQHGSGLLDECRNSGIYMIVGGDSLRTAYNNYINPLTYSVIGIRKDITSCEFFKQFNDFYKLKSDSSTLIQIIDSKEAADKEAAVRAEAVKLAEAKAQGEVANISATEDLKKAAEAAATKAEADAKTAAAAAAEAKAAVEAKAADAKTAAAAADATKASEAATKASEAAAAAVEEATKRAKAAAAESAKAAKAVESAKAAADAADKKVKEVATNPKPNKLKLTSSYNFKDFIEKLDDEKMSIEGNTENNYIIKFPEYRNFCNLLVNIHTIFDNLCTDNLENYITYRKSNKEPTKAQQIMSILKIKEFSRNGTQLDIGALDNEKIMNLEKIYNYFKDSEINNFNNVKSLKSFKWYFFIEFSITTSKIISVGGIKEVNEQTGLPALHK
jgi:hypothetical protein